MRRAVAIAAAYVVTASLSAQSPAPPSDEPFTPARMRGGGAPALSPMALGGGQVFLELAVGTNGSVTNATPLRTTPPFTNLVTTAVRGWQFEPAREVVPPPAERPNDPPIRRTIPSTVLVAAVYRAPSLLTPTLGEAPKDVAQPAAETPFPAGTAVPQYPIQARAGGVVVVEVRLDRSGSIAETKVVRSAPPFDDAALNAVRQWSFRPARHANRPAPAFAYAILGFPEPVGPATGPARGRGFN